MFVLTVAGEPLRALLRSPRKMLSSALKSMLIQRGASSIAGKGIEFSGEKDFEESSKPKAVEAEASKSLEVLGEVSGTRVESIAARTSDRKRSRRHEEEVAQPSEKRSKGLMKLRGNDVKKPEVPSKEVEGLLGDEVFSASKAAKTAKDLLDQVRVFSIFSLSFFLLICLVIASF